MTASETREGEPAARGRRVRWRRGAAITAVVAVLLAVAFRVALPVAVERLAPALGARFGFAVALANVDFALLRGHLTLEGLRVAPLAPSGTGRAAPDLLTLDRGFVDLEWLRLLRGEVEVAALVLDKPALALLRAPDGYIELPAPPPSTEPKPPEPEPAPEPGEPLPIRIRSLTIRDTAFRLVDGAGGPDLVDFSLAELGFDDLQLAGSKLGLGGIHVAEPRLRVRREVRDTKVGARGATPASETEPSAAAPPDLRIDRLEIERAEFSVVTEGEPVSVALHLVTSDVSLAPNAPFPVDFALEAAGGSVSLAGRLGLNPPVWDGKVAWQGLEVPLLVRAALPELVPWIESCSASGDLDVKLGAETLRVAGRLGADDFSVRDPEEELALGWKRLAIELREATVPLDGESEAIAIALGTISLDAPRARYVLPNSAVERLLAQAGAARAEDAPAEPRAEAPSAPPAEPPAEATPAPEPHITLDKLEVRGGSAEFVDRSGAEPYQGRVRDLRVDLAGLALPERTVQSLRVRGIAPENAPFDLRAALPGAQGTVSFTLERLPLAQFSPYAESAADLRIPRGELALETKGRLERKGAAGNVETRVVVHQLSIQSGPKAVSVAGMPLDLALALLRDPKGNISLPVPLSYGEQGTSVSIRTVLRGALEAAIAGAVTSPIKALGALVPKGGGAQISFEAIGFAAGSAALPDGAAKRLAPLASLLAERPGLGLALVGRAGPDDRLALAERMLVERVGAGQGLPELADAGFFARRRVQGALAARARGEDAALEAEDQALLARYVEATDVPPARYQALAAERAEAVRALLAERHAVAPERLVAETSAEAGAPAVLPELRVGAGPAEESAAP